MAKTENIDYSLRRGKMNKKDKTVYRMRNGKQQSYIPSENTNPPSKAQKAHRALFGKINSVVNAIMADPVQTAEWENKRIEHNRTIPFTQKEQRFETTRSFVFASIRTQLTRSKDTKRKRRAVKLELPKGFKLYIKPFAELSATELYEILKARFAVFYMEQHCYYQDMDNIDYKCIHLALHRRGKVIAYARLFKGRETGQWIAGRTLTIERKQGFGKFIMEQTLLEAQRQGATSLLIHAQLQAVPFYEKLGFTTVGEVFQEADIAHILMKKSLA